MSLQIAKGCRAFQIGGFFKVLPHDFSLIYLNKNISCINHKLDVFNN